MTTPTLGLDELAAAQNQPHVLINRTSRKLEALVQGVAAAIQNAPPGSPADGARYIVGDSPSGAWVGHDGEVAFYSAGWQFVTPETGWLFYVTTPGAYYSKSDDSPSAWAPFAGGGGGGGSLTVEDLTSSPGATVTDVTTIEVVGANVDSPAPGVARIIVTGGGGGSSPLTTKGDLFGHSSVDARIPVGSDGDVLTADSGAALGVSWQAGGGGGGGGGDIVDVILAGDFGYAIPNGGAYTALNTSFATLAAGGTSGSITPNSAIPLECGHYVKAFTAASGGSYATIYQSGTSFLYVKTSGSALAAGFRVGGIIGWYCATAANLDASRAYWGLQDDADVPSLLNSSDPSALGWLIGIGKDAGDANLQFMCNDASGTATKVDMGVTASSLSGLPLALEISGNAAGSSLDVKLTDISTGTVYSHTFTSNLPPQDVPMKFVAMIGTAATTAAQNVYLNRYAWRAGAGV